MGGIVNDVQALISQQVQMTRAEIKSDLRKLWEAGALFAPGVGLLVVSAIVLSLMLAHLLHALTAPAGTDPASLPLWACYGIVGVVLAVVGGALAFMGKKTLDSVNPMSGPTAQSLEENMKWMSNPK
jgi:hypothetical protein